MQTYFNTTVIAPLHVSGIWVPHYSEDPIETGSVGAGLNLTLYLEAKFRKGPCTIILNGESIFVEQAKKICENAGVDVETHATTPFALGRGFAISAATLVSHSIAAHMVADKPLLRALQIAHILEVKHKTGLGDVIAEYTGGFAIRLRPGAPGVGLAYRILPRSRADLIVADLGTLEPTSTMLSRMKVEDYELGKSLLKKIVESEDLRIFFECSRIFTSRLFDYTKAKNALKGLPGIIDYYVKKSALIVWIEKESVQEILEELKRRGIKALYATISNIGVVLVHSAKSPKKN